MYESLKEVEKMQKLAIVKSATEETFISGTDYREVANSPTETVKDRFRNELRSFHLLATYEIPSIALMSGFTSSNAFMSAKYRVSTEKSSFQTKGPQFGFFTDSGSSFYLPRLERNFGIFMGLTGSLVTGYDVKKFGLSTHFVESKSVRDLEEILVNCENDLDIESVLDEFSSTPTNIESKMNEKLEKIETCFAGLTVEQILENLKYDGGDWATETTKILRQVSPISLKVCHRLLSLGRHMSLEDCAKLEWRLAVQFALRSDLHETCLMDVEGLDMTGSSNKPAWNFETIEEVTEHHLSRFFGPLPDGDQLKFEMKRSTEGFHVE